MPRKVSAKSRKFTHCIGSPSWRPDEFVEDEERQKEAEERLGQNDLLRAVAVAFRIPERDAYVYHAMTSVTLAEVQRVVGLGGVNGLHAWYPPNADGSTVRPRASKCLLRARS
jgi:hypothetical protein